MSDSRRGSADPNQNFVAFVMTELDAGLVFMDLADTSRIPETKERNQCNARKAYDTAMRFLKNVSLEEAQQEEIDLKLAALKNRLMAVGEL